MPNAEMPKQIEYRHFNDPIHGMIKFPKDGLICKLIDTPEFQRLRRIKQLGYADYVYPGATHTRFAHSIGVAYLVEKAVKQLFESRALDEDNLNEDFPGYENKDQVILAMTVAGLLHDIGHAPFSHALEEIIIRKSHERIAEDIIKGDCNISTEHSVRNVIINNINNSKLPLNKRLPSKIIEYKLSNKDIEQYQVILDIVNTICGEKGLDAEEPKKNRLAIIASLVSSQLDCDRIDYLLRDTYFCGIPNRIDYEYIFSRMQVREVKALDNMKRVCFSKKALTALYEFLFIRYIHYVRIVKHRVVISCEALLREVCKDITVSLLDFIQLDDVSIMEKIRRKRKKKSEHLDLDALKNRYLYDFVDNFSYTSVEKIMQGGGIDDNDYISCTTSGSKYYKIQDYKIDLRQLEALESYYDNPDKMDDQRIQDLKPGIHKQLDMDILVYDKQTKIVRPIYLTEENNKYTKLIELCDKEEGWLFAHPEYYDKVKGVWQDARTS